MRYFILGLLLFNKVALGQTATDTVKNRIWLQTVTKNALKTSGDHDHFKKATGGYALYFSQVDTLKVPYLVYVPQKYNPSEHYPLVVYLHGGLISIDEFEYKDPEFAEEPIFSIADKYNVLILFPFGRKSFGWIKDQKAFENVVSIIDSVKNKYNIDNQKVYLGGMSNGASATFWFISKTPDLFAGFYSFSALPKLKLTEINFKNINADKPLYSIHAKDDSVHYFSDVKSVYELHKKESPGWHFDTIESGGHGFIYNDNGIQIIDNLFKKLLKIKKPRSISKKS